MDDDEEDFKDIKICFTDKRHANIKLFGEELKAVLISLPTIVETHRTVDGSHLFKSADVGEILIVHRPNAPPEGISEDFVYDHGLTPPTLNIVKKRLYKQEAARANQPESSSIEGIKYWEMVEIQLAALLSKEKTAKPVCRQEFLEEPDVNPVTLEKILRRNGKSEFKGYSGQVIEDSEIDDITAGDDPVIHIPEEIVNEIIPTNEGNATETNESAEKSSEEKTTSGEIMENQTEETEDTFESTTAGSSASEVTSATTSDVSSDNESENNEEEEEEEEEEDADDIDERIKKLKNQIGPLETNYIFRQHKLEEAISTGNQHLIERSKQVVASLKQKKEEIEAEIASLLEKKAQKK